MAIRGFPESFEPCIKFARKGCWQARSLCSYSYSGKLLGEVSLWHRDCEVNYGQEMRAYFGGHILTLCS